MDAAGPASTAALVFTSRHPFPRHPRPARQHRRPSAGARAAARRAGRRRPGSETRRGPVVTFSSVPVPRPPDEAERLASLRSYEVLDTPADARLDAITRHAARFFAVPIVLVSLIDDERQWCKSAIGVPQGSQTVRDFAFCAHALLRPEQVLVVEDTRADVRFAANPLVTGFPHICFYAGAPLIGADGYALGTLCLLDNQPRRMTAEQIAALRDLALTAAAVLDLHRSVVLLRESVEHHQAAVALNPQIPWTAGRDGRLETVSPRWLALTGMTPQEALNGGWTRALHPEDVQGAEACWARSRAAGQPLDTEYRLRMRDGGFRWFRSYAAPRRDAAGTILRWYGVVEDITERRASQQRTEHFAYHDSLTGLPNRLRFREALERQAAQAARERPFALLCLDLDSFKAVNDTLGHPAGDALLCEVARRLRGCVRETDMVARVGGDEFLVIQTAIDDGGPDRGADGPAATVALAERILESLAAPMKVMGHTLAIGASIGIALCPRDGAQPDKLLQNADLALYRAKAEGRRGWRFFASGMDERLRRRQALKVDLRDALDHSELDLAYQPLVGLRSGRVEGFEALLRWQHPQRGAVAPSEFIPAAELNGLIMPIGQWALRHACVEAMRWPGDVRLAVNLSAVQFGQRELPEVIAEALSGSGLPPERLELEITESVQLLDNDANLALLQHLRAIGVRIVLDDFGTGYASLGYLQRFRFDKLKIDRSFVARMTEMAEARAIVSAVLAMGRAMGIEVAAEGVETEAQLAMLRAEGCDQAQGYLLGRPVPAAGVPALLGPRLACC